MLDPLHLPPETAADIEEARVQANAHWGEAFRLRGEGRYRTAREHEAECKRWESLARRLSWVPVRCVKAEGVPQKANRPDEGIVRPALVSNA